MRRAHYDSEQKSDEETMMKRLIAAIATTLFMASAGATHVYHGLAEGDPDLHGYGHDDQRFVGVQPGVGDSADIYQGFGPGNSDLFPILSPVIGSNVENPDQELPRIYKSFSGNRDLSW
jgi:hypothetical protein